MQIRPHSISLLSIGQVILIPWLLAYVLLYAGLVSWESYAAGQQVLASYAGNINSPPHNVSGTSAVLTMSIITHVHQLH